MKKDVLYIWRAAILTFLAIVGIAAVDVGNEKGSDLLMIFGFCLNFGSLIYFGMLLQRNELQ